jgi:hypothetical protein
MRSCVEGEGRLGLKPDGSVSENLPLHLLQGVTNLLEKPLQRPILV